MLIAARAGQAETRVALVIGNADYTTLAPLKNPVNDANDIAAALEGLGFQVTLGIDAGRAAMAELISRHVRAARNANVSLFYYAGHGFQIDQQNYLVPIDAMLRRRAEVTTATIALNEITGALAGSAGIHLIFLDACRNNPLPATLGDDPALRYDGLAEVGDAAGFLFVFATQPRNVAYDGVGRNSFFAQALLGHLGAPGQDIAAMMIDVRNDVLAATGGKQVPWENSSLTRQFAFAPGAESASPETLLWQIGATSQDPKLMRIYLERYPEGAHVADARTMLAGMQMPPLAAAEGAVVRDLPAPATAPALADALWDLARRSRQRSLVEAYLAQDPDGPHAEEARAMLTWLPRPDDPGAAPEFLCEHFATHPHDATANTAGVPLVDLARNAVAAQDACRRAAAAHPELPHFTALLARATFAGGDKAGAARLYRDAADRGDVRAMFSLARMLETGDGVPKDIPAAIALYERSAAGRNADSAINLAVALLTGAGTGRDVLRALALLRQASAAGSGAATQNLGVLAQRGVGGDAALALDYFRQAAALGEPRAYVPAAILLDEGRGGARDPEAAADLLLRGVASDYGEALGQLTGKAQEWHPATLVAVQARLQAAGFYGGALDGISGPKFAAALQLWRNRGYVASD